MAKRALITGITGQDAAYLAQLLLSKQYEVYGTYRRCSSPNFWRLNFLGILDRIRLLPADMTDAASLYSAVSLAKPDEVYNLAAQSFVGTSFEEPVMTANVDALGVQRLLEVILKFDPMIKFYQASTSEMYGNANGTEEIDESSPMVPASPYGAAKLHAYHATRIYRQSHGLFACNGILFNHESPLRGLEFVTRKITNAAAAIKFGQLYELRLGNLDARRDFGYAAEYVNAMWLMLQADEPDDYVIATGQAFSVRQVCVAAFGRFGLNWEDHVVYDPALERPIDVACLVGNPAKAHRKLGWLAKEQAMPLIEYMTDIDYHRWKSHLDGESFAWDIPSSAMGRQANRVLSC